MKFLKLNRGKMLLVFVLHFCTLVAAPLSAKILSSILENIQTFQFPVELVLLYIFMKCLNYCGAAISEYQFRKLELSITEMEEKTLYKRLDNQSLNMMARFTPGQLLEKFSVIKEYAQKMITPAILVEEFLVSVLLFVFLLIDLHTVKIIYILFPVLLWCVFSVFFQKKLGQKLIRKLEKREKLRACLSEIIGNLESILAFNHFGFVKKEFQKEQEDYRKKEVSYTGWEEAKQVLNQTTIIWGKFMIFFSFWGRTGNFQAELISGFLLIEYLYQPFFVIQNIFQTFNEMKINKKIVEQELEELTGSEQKWDIQKTEKKALVELRHVNYTYDGSEKKVLNDISFIIPVNGCGMLIGKSGSGKSTLLNLIVGILRPDNGQILYGQQFDEKDIVYMEQFPVVFSMSVKDNLCLGREISQRELEEVCKQVQIHKTIEKLPQGYDTILAEGGKNLSGGQIQRIVLARTLLRNAKLIILDEPTSALDQETEKQFWEIISQRKKTASIFVITHNSEAVKYADYVYELMR